MSRSTSPAISVIVGAVLALICGAALVVPGFQAAHDYREYRQATVCAARATAPGEPCVTEVAGRLTRRDINLGQSEGGFQGVAIRLRDGAERHVLLRGNSEGGGDSTPVTARYHESALVEVVFPGGEAFYTSDAPGAAQGLAVLAAVLVLLGVVLLAGQFVLAVRPGLLRGPKPLAVRIARGMLVAGAIAALAVALTQLGVNGRIVRAEMIYVALAGWSALAGFVLMLRPPSTARTMAGRAVGRLIALALIGLAMFGVIGLIGVNASFVAPPDFARRVSALADLTGWALVLVLPVVVSSLPLERPGKKLVAFVPTTSAAVLGMTLVAVFLAAVAFTFPSLTQGQTMPAADPNANYFQSPPAPQLPKLPDFGPG